MLSSNNKTWAICKDIEVCNLIAGYKPESCVLGVQVIEQVEHVALAVKQGSEISDLRHHTFSAPALKVKACVVACMTNFHTYHALVISPLI